MEAAADRKLAVVTGASSGIGFELAKVFGEEGYDLLITAEDAELSAAQEQLKATGRASKRTWSTSRPRPG
jgi:short-subunit dehydrogenase